MDILQIGFSQGEPSISNDDELAAQVAGFMEQFLEVFSELKGSNFWVSGESVSVITITYTERSNARASVRRIL